MQQDLRSLSEAEIKVMAERALAGGASENYVIKYLIDGGVSENSAKGIVAEKAVEFQAKREQRLKEEVAENEDEWRKSRNIAAGWILLGALLITVQQLLIPTQPRTLLFGVFCLWRGVRRLLSQFLHRA
jgi:hypothetical protein